MRIIRVGSRGSRLALWQTDLVVQSLRKVVPEARYEITVIKTTGDKLLDVALSRIGDKGLFTKEIEKELLAGNIDLAVHSMKDVPTVVPPGLTIAAVLKRDNPCDVLISRSGLSLQAMPRGAKIGTSSLRRRAQLKIVRPDIEVVDLRGNIETRMRKLKEEDLDGIIVAFAGVNRLGFGGSITEELDLLPAVGQGAIGIESRDNDEFILKLLAGINDQATLMEVNAERSFLATLEGGCQIPIGALARSGSILEIEGLVADLSGVRVYRDRIKGDISQAEQLGKSLALRLIDMGADQVLKEIRDQESQI
ncbi:MAG: hydroxymethylbilane synthase [Chitinophagales bacterium]